MDSHHSNYDKILILADFNSKNIESSMHKFCNFYSVSSLCNKPLYYKNSEKSSCIDLWLTSLPRSAQNTGLSDFFKLAVTVLKMYFQENKSNIITYRNYKNFENVFFLGETNTMRIQWVGIVLAELRTPN